MNEKVILSDQPSNARARILWPLIAIVVGAPFLLAGWLASGSEFGTVAGIIAVGIVIVADVALVLASRSRRGVVYMLTPTRILRVWAEGKGRFQQAVPLASVQSVTVAQTPVGRMLKYGTVVLEAGEYGTAYITDIPRPQEWEKAILEARR